MHTSGCELCSIFTRTTSLQAWVLHEYSLLEWSRVATCHLECVNSSHNSLALATALCSDPADIVNGMVTFTGNSVGDTATYTCDMGFELIGSATTTCTQVDVNSAAFSPDPPVCRREYCIILTFNHGSRLIN